MNPSILPPEGIVCHFCGRCFSTDQDLKEDVRNREKEQVYCVCDRTFLTKHYIERHMRTHARELHGICYVCNKKCLSKTHLDIHMEIHTAARPHRCDVCNRRFARKNNLCRHRSVHTEEKPFGCDICGKRFARKEYLNRHFRTCSRKKQISDETSSEDSDGTAIHNTALTSVDPAGIDSSVATSSKLSHENYEPSYRNEYLGDEDESLFRRGRNIAEVARDPKPSELEGYEDCQSGSDCVPSDINGVLHKPRDSSNHLTSPESGAGERETNSFLESGMSVLLPVGEPSTSTNEGASLIGNTSDPSRVDPVASDIAPVKHSATGFSVDDGISDVLLKCENCDAFFSDLLSYALHSIEH